MLNDIRTISDFVFLSLAGYGLVGQYECIPQEYVDEGQVEDEQDGGEEEDATEGRLFFMQIFFKRFRFRLDPNLT